MRLIHGMLLAQALIVLAVLAGCSDEPSFPGQRIAGQGGEHISAGQDHPPYNTVPATSGPHYTRPYAPAPWDIYDQVLPDEVLVHNLEHGGIGVSYNCPDGCDELVKELGDIVSTAVSGGLKVIMAPYPGMDTRIALTAWNFIDKFDQLDKNRVQDFITAHESSPNAPEYNAR